MKADPGRLYQDVEFLTAIHPPRNYRNLDSLERVARYVRQAFDALGLETRLQSWTAGGREYHNVIGSYQPQFPDRLIVGAHYDVCGDQPGADDNASAVAGLLETARLISRHRPAIDYGVDFVAYNLEEPPFFATEQMGSYVHAKSLRDQKASVLGMICYEMIGYFSDEPGSQQFPDPMLARNYPDTGNFIIVVGIEEQAAFSQRIHSLMLEKAAIDVRLINFPGREALAGLSDQRSYWHFGYNAVMINDTSFLRNPHYHERTDTIDTLDFPKMAEVVNGCYHAITHFRSTSDMFEPAAAPESHLTEPAQPFLRRWLIRISIIAVAAFLVYALAFDEDREMLHLIRRFLRELLRRLF